ncbi:hypothetical protein JRO89_XS15G0154700 [Xanthoceras sorbifolium]|uniref:Uncharacterized protein n=1 Tax=Xanthoceras sorbifolium TaxID=99658 RepID=A0ABQ8H2B2_9ROSI|nr:hypothetical protein JRO89_XS15G0154700 [Xanthoceras sorbifolium]
MQGGRHGALPPPTHRHLPHVVYIEESAEQLVGAMGELVSDDGLVLSGYQLRSPEAHKLFRELCRKAFVIEKVPREDLHPDYAYEEADVYILKKKNKKKKTLEEDLE